MVVAFLAGAWLGSPRGPEVLDAGFPKAMGGMVAQAGNYAIGITGTQDSAVIVIVDTNKELMIGYRARLVLGVPARFEPLEPLDLRAIFRRLDTARPKPK